MNSVNFADKNFEFLTFEQMIDFFTQESQQTQKKYRHSKSHAIWICKQPTNSYANIVKHELSMQVGAALYLTELLKEILRMSLREKTDISSPDRCVYCGKNLQRTIQLGRLINKVRRKEGMLFVASKIPVYDQAEINICWDGIGEWRA